MKYCEGIADNLSGPADVELLAGVVTKHDPPGRLGVIHGGRVELLWGGTKENGGT